MDAAWIGIIIVSMIYLTGLLLFLRRCFINHKQNKKIEKQTIIWEVIGGIVLMFLIVLKLIRG
jgi:RsiW-degrading membrane proteinase PrsW (M82 family)